MPHSGSNADAYALAYADALLRQCGDVKHVRDVRTDLLTLSHPTLNPATCATRTRGQQKMTDTEHHAHNPHVYVVYWPEFGIIKAGVSAVVRWTAWHRRGAVTVATYPAGDMATARMIEARLLDIFARYGGRAFHSESEARFALGANRGGFSECYRLVQSPRFGKGINARDCDCGCVPPDYEGAYGLILPPPAVDVLHEYLFTSHRLTDTWRAA